MAAGTWKGPITLNGEFSKAGNRPKDGNDYVLYDYDRKIGILSYDPDGSGLRKPVEFAQLKKGLALTCHDFLVG
jgi:hypothetical protein